MEFKFCGQFDFGSIVIGEYVGAGRSLARRSLAVRISDRLAQILARSNDGFLPSVA
jgi:hypothetical protein